MLLCVNNLKVFYDKTVAVEGIDLYVEEGEFVSIIGSNGAGKTSTINALSGIVQREGEILFREEKIDGLPPDQVAKRGIIQVPEGRKLFPILSVLDNLKMGAFLQKDKNAVQRTMDKIFTIFPILHDKLHQRADSLSGGQQQMLAIARALMASPILLMLDEPSLGLSPLICQDVEACLEKINQEGTAILLSEQNVKMGLRISNRAYVFEKGIVTLEGNSKDLIKNEEVKKAYLGL